MKQHFYHIFRKSILAFVISSTVSMNSFAADPFNCQHNRCGLQGDGTYPNLVLGTVEHIGQGKDSEQVYHWAHQHGWWKTLPDDAHKFAKNVHPILIKVPTVKGSALVIGLMTDDEFQTAPLQIGDFVRYSPHDANHPHPKENTPDAWAYWRLVGCVQVICRASDKKCMQGFRFGVYQLKTGIPIDLKTGKTTPAVPGIDPITYAPKTKLN